MTQDQTNHARGERALPRQDSVDFLAAFAVGTVLGIGATLLLQPQRTPKERVLKQLKPYRKQMRRSYSHARSAVRDSASATADLTGETFAAGREILGEFRDEVARILGDARSEIQSMVEDQVHSVSRQIRKPGRRFGR